jgi:hypothetical protein
LPLPPARGGSRPRCWRTARSGQTTLANIIARELGELHGTSGPAIERPGDLAAILTNLDEGDVLFIDEIHRLNHAVEEILYPAMEDFAIDVMIGRGPSARSLRLGLKPFTVVGATTRAGRIGGPLRDRFGRSITRLLLAAGAATIVQRSADPAGHRGTVQSSSTGRNAARQPAVAPGATMPSRPRANRRRGVARAITRWILTTRARHDRPAPLAAIAASGPSVSDARSRGRSTPLRRHDRYLLQLGFSTARPGPRNRACARPPARLGYEVPPRRGDRTDTGTG